MGSLRLALREIKKIFAFLLLAFIIIGLVSSLTLVEYREFVEAMVDNFMSDKADILISEGWQLALELFNNNLQASVVAYAVGILPFLFLSSFTVMVNGALLGAVYVYLGGFISPVGYIMSLLPHGIFEIPAFIISVSLGIKLCLELSRKLMRRDYLPLGPLIKRQLMTLLFIVVPLLIIAAYIEAFITPLIMEWLFF
ncbi:MAG: stage II sporulation protein M [Tissierellia bacterium]|nr:stage II sporulation protein M [Tissierellia bacterium]